jgi:hypothetical protein
MRSSFGTTGSQYRRCERRPYLSIDVAGSAVAPSSRSVNEDLRRWSRFALLNTEVLSNHIRGGRLGPAALTGI